MTRSADRVLLLVAGAGRRSPGPALRFVLAMASFLLPGVLYCQAPGTRHTESVVFVMSDGLRWQELFRGADPALLNRKYGNVVDGESLKRRYWRGRVEERRRALMPFLWSVIAAGGQIYGNLDRGSASYVVNGKNISYPGYGETLCGFADPRIDSNKRLPNPDVTILEWLNRKPGYRGRVAAFGAWDVFPAILNASRAGFPVSAGYDQTEGMPANPRMRLLNELKTYLPQVWEEEPFDAIPFYAALEYLQERKPRVLFVSLGETDDWAHKGDYGEYLRAIHRADSYLRILWEQLQSMPEYRDRTTLIFSTDHGRGNGPTSWKEHGRDLPESKYTWLAMLGPDTPPIGERANIAAITNTQIAATLAAILGEDYAAARPEAGKPIPDASFSPSEYRAEVRK